MIKSIIIPLLASSALVLVACGQSEPTPTSEQLFKKSQQAIAQQKGVNLSVTSNIAGNSQIKAITSLDQDLTIKLSGPASKQAVQMSGAVNYGATSWPVTLRADQTRTDVKIGQYWVSGGSGTEDLGERVSPFKGLLRDIMTNPNEFLQGEVKSENNIWVFEGGLNETALKSMEQKTDGLTPVETKQIEDLAQGFKATISFSKSTTLPVSLQFQYQGSSAGARAMLGLVSILDYGQQANLSLSAKFDQWGAVPKLSPVPKSTEASVIDTASKLLTSPSAQTGQSKGQ